jgi:hypothetical protein
MKNSKDYSIKIKKLHKSLTQKHNKVKNVVHEKPVEAIVYGILGEVVPESELKSAFGRFDEYFVDFNDMRVCRPEEIADMLRDNSQEVRNASLCLIKVLRYMFQKHHTLNLDFYRKMGKRPAKQELEKIEGLSTFAINYFMLTYLQGHSIPLTRTMVEYLKENDFVHPDSDEQEIEGFLCRIISTSNGYEFYSLLRKESEIVTAKKTQEAGKKETKKSVTPTVKKTVKKDSKKTARKSKK